MEKHTVESNLQQSRDEIREMLMPGAASGRTLSGQFPRSTVMRLLMDSKKRRIAMAMVSTALMLAGRRRRHEGDSRWPQIRQVLLPLLGGSRRP